MKTDAFFSGPAGIYSPIVTLLSPHSAKVQWEEPEITNGPIIRYEVLFPEPRYTLKGDLNFTLVVEELIPFTEYQVLYIIELLSKVVREFPYKIRLGTD